MKQYLFLALALLVSLQSSGAVKEKLRKLSNVERIVEDYSISDFGMFEDEDFFVDFNRELHSSMSMPGKSNGKGGKGKGGKGKGGKSKSKGTPSSTPSPSPKSKGKSDPKPASGKGDDDDDDNDGKG